MTHRILPLIASLGLLLLSGCLLATPVSADGTFSISQSFPVNGAGIGGNPSVVPVNLIGPGYLPPAGVGYANQSISLSLSGLPSNGCSLDNSSVNAQTSRLLSSNPNDSQYALTNPAFGRHASGWWLAVRSAVDGFELLSNTIYTLHVSGGINGIVVKCANQNYYLNQPDVAISFQTGSDTVAPSIMGPYVNATNTTATINWETFQAASGQVAYGQTVLNATANQSGFSKLHQVYLSQLNPGTTYNYQIRSTDAAGNKGTYNGQFTTVGLGEIKVTDVTDMAATIKWITNQPTDTLVEFGQTTGYGDRQGNGGQITNHSLRLVGLQPDHTYHFRVVATNSSGSSTFGDNTFTTLASPSVAGTSSTSEGANSSDENIKLFPQVPLVEPLVLGASNAASAVSDGITVGRNLLSGKALPAQSNGWLVIAWILPILLLIIIGVLWWIVRRQARQTVPQP